MAGAPAKCAGPFSGDTTVEPGWGGGGGRGSAAVGLGGWLSFIHSAVTTAGLHASALWHVKKKKKKIGGGGGGMKKKRGGGGNKRSNNEL